MRAERSLRPRKPIQEHPYLLESAQYAHLMKSRGFKPVKMVREPEPVSKDDQDLGDNDFDADESQDRGDETQNTNEERGLLLPGEDIYDVDELALSPSPRLSSVRAPAAIKQSAEQWRYGCHKHGR